MLVAHLLLTTRPWGRHVYALGGDERSAAMAGLPVSRLKMQCYMLSGVLAGFAGFLLASRLGTGSPIIGDATPLTAAAAALLGGASLQRRRRLDRGIFRRPRSSSACLINVMNHLDVPSYYQRMTIGGLLFALVVAGGLLHAFAATLSRTRLPPRPAFRPDDV